MTRIFTILMMLCACMGLNAVDDQPRYISIRPFTGALAPHSLAEEDATGTVTFQKQPYWIRPTYKLFLQGAPALKVCLGFEGTRMDVYLPVENKEIKIVSTNWLGDRYEGVIGSKQGLSEAGINEEELLQALSLLPAIHYNMSKHTWTIVNQNAVEEGLVALMLNVQQPQEILDKAADIMGEVSEAVKDKAHILADKIGEVKEGIKDDAQAWADKASEIKDAIGDKIGEVKDNIKDKAQTVKDAVEDKAQETKDALHTKVLTLADQAEEAYLQAVEFLHPPTREEEAQAIAEFAESLPETLKNVEINSPQRRV